MPLKPSVGSTYMKMNWSQIPCIRVAEHKLRFGGKAESNIPKLLQVEYWIYIVFCLIPNRPGLRSWGEWKRTLVLIWVGTCSLSLPGKFNLWFERMHYWETQQWVSGPENRFPALHPKAHAERRNQKWMAPVAPVWFGCACRIVHLCANFNSDAHLLYRCSCMHVP